MRSVICCPTPVQTDITVTSKGLRDSEEKHGETQRFKFLCQDIGDTATGELTCGDAGKRVVMRSPCAGAPLDPPVWTIVFYFGLWTLE